MQSRPVFLNMLQIRLPIPGIMSILHRASGVLMVLLTALLVWLLDQSLSGEEGYALVAGFFGSIIGKLSLFIFLWMLMHHLFAGIRYLLLDIDVGIEKIPARYSALAVMVAAPLVAALLVGVM